jgi:hypothetical protein
VFDDVPYIGRCPPLRSNADLEARNPKQVKEFLQLNTPIFLNPVQTIKLLIAEENLIAA